MSSLPNEIAWPTSDPSAYHGWAAGHILTRGCSSLIRDCGVFYTDLKLLVIFGVRVNAYRCARSLSSRRRTVANFECSVAHLHVIDHYTQNHLILKRDEEGAKLPNTSENRHPSRQ
jgi:hypothetical protein